jgi:hypothetical protein
LYLIGFIFNPTALFHPVRIQSKFLLFLDERPTFLSILIVK